MGLLRRNRRVIEDLCRVDKSRGTLKSLRSFWSSKGVLTSPTGYSRKTTLEVPNSSEVLEDNKTRRGAMRVDDFGFENGSGLPFTLRYERQSKTFKRVLKV